VTLSILQVDPERGWGGGQAQLVELCRHLVERGHRVLVACRPDGELCRALTADRVEVRALRIRNDIDLIGALQLWRILRAERFDIVHCQTARAHATAAWLPRRHHRFIVTRHMDYQPRFRPRVKFLYNRRVDGVIAVSEAIATVLAEAGVERSRVRVIHVGIDSARFEGHSADREAVRREWGAAAGDVVLFTAAVLERRKGHEVLLRALVRLVCEGLPVRWVIAGDGSLRADLEARVLAAGMRERVVFTGFSSDVPRLLAGADAFVLPSRQEGLGIAVMEAMAAGLPVVASRVGGLPEIVVEGETGLLVPAGDADALARALRRLAADRARMPLLGEQGRRRVLQRFSSTTMAAAVEAYYYELLRGRNPREQGGHAAVEGV
jgi:L-malate glycosyltransferase